jgi:hypothetical protein
MLNEEMDDDLINTTFVHLVCTHTFLQKHIRFLQKAAKFEAVYSSNQTAFRL